MKRVITFVLAFAMVLGFGIGSAMAANSLRQGNLSLGVGIGSDDFIINGRYLVSRDLAIIAGIGFSAADAGDAGDASSFGFQGGVRKYLSTSDFAPFFGGQLSFRSEETIAGTDTTTFALQGVFGAEYFLGNQFSVEGSVGLGFSKSSEDPANIDTTTFETGTAALSANFYF